MRRPLQITESGTRVLLAGLVVTILAVAALVSIDAAVRSSAQRAATESARGDAAILAAGLQSELDKFSLVPLVLADDPQVRAVLSASPDQAEILDRRLETLARQTDAAAIYLMTNDGETLAASNWSLPTSFVGSNYSFRHYFRAALETGSATQFALGTVSRTPGLYIAHRVMSGPRAIGVVAVKVEFDALEANWRSISSGVFVTDRDGVVLLTSNPEWRFHVDDAAALGPRDRRRDFQQFGTDTLLPLEAASNASGRGLATAPLLDTRQPIALDGWMLHLLVDPSNRIGASLANARFYMLLALALTAALGAGAYYFRRRREERARLLLAQRTQALREQLNQANRLATLGQVSAGVGHEISQPVAAARLFAENGERLLAAGKIEAAGANFARIVELADRIGLITAELRRFSRRDAPEPQDVPLASAVDGAVLLLRDRLQHTNVTLSLPPASDLDIIVRAEPVRLEQVLVNLIQNALDASGTEGQIAIELVADQRWCKLAVTDDGPGIDPEQAERLFQPFATTKPGGLGLGLVISRDIMRELGGDLVLEPSLAGARFVMKVPRA